MTETRFQSEWFDSFSLAEVVQLTRRFTVAQLLAREDFSNRYAANQPITITELLYPLLQAYDSIAVESDVEFGGMDQKFNLLMGRDLQEMMDQRPQQCVLVPLLPGTDGIRKMSKSLNNYIGVDEPPSNMYGKTMSLPDNMIIPYFINLTDVSDQEISEFRQDMKIESVKAMELKKQLARHLVTQFHGAKATLEAEDNFERTVQRRETPKDMTKFELPSPLELRGKRLSHILVDSKLTESSSEARRLINQGAVEIDGKPVATNILAESLHAGNTLRVGRRRFLKFVAPDAR